MGDRASSIAVPRLWNALSADIQSSPSLAHFKGSLKTHLMKEAFAYFFLCFLFADVLFFVD